MLIYLDMDGVLVDFVGHSLTTLGRKETREDITSWDMNDILGMSLEDFWAGLNTFEFWSTIPVFDHATELVKIAESYGEVAIATKILPTMNEAFTRCVNGKLHSLRENFPDITYHLTQDKSHLALPGSVLIDDNENNCAEFEARGGKAILFPAHYNSNAPHIGRELEYVRERLDTLTKPTSIHNLPEVIITDPKTGGKKGQKPARHDLIPVRPLLLLACRFGYGSIKYQERNWEKGYPWSFSYASLRRHIDAFWDGEDIDPQDDHGQTHLSAVMWHAFALTEFYLRGIGTDDRPYK